MMMLKIRAAIKMIFVANVMVESSYFLFVFFFVYGSNALPLPL